jgi:hypothetical protein
MHLLDGAHPLKKGLECHLRLLRMRVVRMVLEKLDERSWISVPRRNKAVFAKLD